MPSGSASTSHHAHLHLSTNHAGWPLSIGLCACLPWPGSSPPGPGASSVKGVSLRPGLEETTLTHHVAILVAGASPSTGVPSGWFSQCGVEGPPTPCLRGSACPRGTLFCGLCLRSGTGPALFPAALPRAACWKITPNRMRALPSLTYLRAEC